ncbi:MAG: hypothetical protein KJO54_00865 [Gammaproteobacteria bacterium]|nr:hypothetical protein [Gammaproteobacteria bacterium]NNF59737.1 hypothetical protein [Gammaproteobacteria bacterium]
MQETGYWLLNIVCAVVILLLLGAHMGVMHLDAILAAVFGITPEPLAWKNMVARGHSNAYTFTYIVLLATALYHGFYGLRTMLLEFFSGERSERAITATCVVAGVVLFAVGSYVTVMFPQGAG